MSAIYRANDKYAAKLTSAWISSPADGDLKVSAVPQHVPTIVVVGYNTDFETVFTVEGKTGDSYYNYTLTGVTRLRGYDDDIPVDTTVNCLNNEEFFNQYVGYMGIEWKGEWDIATAYSAGEGVSYDGSSYIALVDTTGDEPPLVGTWNLVNKRGATWTYGSGAPSAGDGDNEDFYLDVVANNIYVKEADVWGVVTNIKGDTGAQGIQGIQGEPGGTDPASLTDGTFIEDTTNTDTYAGNTIESITAYEAGLIVNLKATNANTGASTLNVNSLGAKSIKKNVIEDLAADDIKAGQVIPLIYDGTNFQIVGGGGGGGGDTSYVQNETPSGLVDSNNDEFTLSSSPMADSLQLYLNGVRQKITDDYTISGTTITFVTPPTTGDKITADYLVNAGSFVGSNSFIYSETPSGTIDGSNDEFTLANEPLTGTLQLFRDGQLLTGGGADYTLATSTITFTTPPSSGSVLLAHYQKEVASTGNADTLDGQHAPIGDIVGTTDTQTLTNKTMAGTANTFSNLGYNVIKADAWTNSGYTVSITNLTVGDATIDGRFCQIGKVVLWRVTVAFANNSSIDGALSINLPVAPNAGYTLVAKIADVTFYDANVGWFEGMVASGGGIRIVNASGNYTAFVATASNVPMDVVSGDYLVINGMYEAQ